MALQPSSFKSASTCQNQVLAVYQAKIRQQQQFLSFIKGMLAAPVAEYVVYCMISGKKLLLYTDTEEWATQLRLHQPIILDAIANSSLPTISTMQVRLMPQPAKQQATRKIKLPSKENIALIRDNLEAIQDDELKSSLRRLSQTLDRLS